jgi:hypothetical protein
MADDLLPLDPSTKSQANSYQPEIDADILRKLKREIRFTSKDKKDAQLLRVRTCEEFLNGVIN